MGRVTRRPFGVDFSWNMDGSANSWLESTSSKVGISDVWSIALWYKPDALTFTISNLLYRLAGVDDIRLSFRAELANDPMQLLVFDDVGATWKHFQWNNILTVDAWNLIVVTFDNGPDEVKLYNNGVLETPIIVNDNSSTGADSSRTISLGANPTSGDSPTSGKLYALGIWSAALTSGEQLTLASGAGQTVDFFTDWRTDHGNYASSASLQHYYRPGLGANIGRDYGVAASGVMILNQEGGARPLIVQDAPVGPA